MHPASFGLALIASSIACADGPPASVADGPAAMPADSALVETFREGLELAASRDALDQGSLVTQVSFSSLRDLWVRVRLADVPTPTRVSLALVDPRGTPIYEATTFYSADPRVTTTELAGVGHPVTVFPAEALPGGYALDYAIPISTGVNQRNPRAGVWEVRASVEGARTFSTSLDVRTTP